MNDEWYCLHVFLSDHDAGTEFLLEWLQPKARQLIEEGSATAWFFLRYWHGGPHFRIRWKGLPEAVRHALLAEAKLAAKRWSSGEPPTREAYYAMHTFDGQPEDIDKLPWWDEGSVISLPYEPEWDRYGGTHGMPVNEMLFNLSSNISLAAIRASQRDLSKRFGLALPLMSASVLAFDPSGETLAEFFRRYAEYWRAVAGNLPVMRGEIAGSVGHGKALGDQIDRIRADRPTKGAEAIWVTGVKRALDQFSTLREKGLLRSPLHDDFVAGQSEFEDAVFSFLSSQIHMMNNRLGLAPAHEFLLARSLVAATTHLADEIEEPKRETAFS